MNKKLIFKKMHGLGNDFVLIDSQKNPDIFNNGILKLNEKELFLIANRNYGIGCDQILVVAPTTNRLAQYDYIIYNQDGSLAKYCGNGARCVIRYLIDNYHLLGSIILNTNGKLTTGYQTANGQISVSSGKPDFNPNSVGYIKDLNKYNKYSFLFGGNLVSFSIVSMGNPHAVIRLDNTQQLVETEQLANIARTLQNSELFSNGVNVNFFVADETTDDIHMRTYERGVGFTLACGSGACATASLAIINKLCDKNVTIHMPGGSLQIKWDQKNEIEMTGDAIFVFDGTMPL